MEWIERQYPELEREPGVGPSVAILPLGAIEAHGPHLPVGADVWIAEAMARAGLDRLLAQGVRAALLPAIHYTPSGFADEFPGTLSIRPETMRLLLLDLGRALARRGVAVLALANSHFDPAQVATLRSSSEELCEEGTIRVAFPDLTRRALAQRLSEEFRSGACHAGRYETSILLAVRPDLVREAARRLLPARPTSLVEAMRRGETTFGQAGLELAYCGDPAAATAEEGRELVELLGDILAESIRTELASSRE
jgi:creatinine amidohydrolase